MSDVAPDAAPPRKPLSTPAKLDVAAEAEDDLTGLTPPPEAEGRGNVGIPRTPAVTPPIGNGGREDLKSALPEVPPGGSIGREVRDEAGAAGISGGP